MTQSHSPSTQEPKDLRRLLVLGLGSIGVVYGDIGTSPLYAFREALRPVAADGVSRIEVIGLISLMVWTLTIIVTLKYVVTDTLALADDSQTPVKNGEKILENCEYSAEKLKWIKRKLEIFAAKAELPIGTPVNTILEAMQDIPVEFTLKHRKYLNRDGEVRYSAQIQDSAFVVML